MGQKRDVGCAALLVAVFAAGCSAGDASKLDAAAVPGQSREAGLRGVLAIHGLTRSDRWLAAWQPYAVKHRKENMRIARTG